MHLYIKLPRIKSNGINIEDLIERCRQEDRAAQQALYGRYAPMLLGLCRRYFNQVDEAEDVMIEGFFKIYKNIDQYDGRGSFEGWMKRLMINEALMLIRKKKIIQVELNDQHAIAYDDTAFLAIDIEPSEIIPLLDKLPEGYRTVFNLYVMEEFKHREIAEMLGISINTSKSQLILAKKKLKQLIESKKTIKNEKS